MLVREGKGFKQRVVLQVEEWEGVLSYLDMYLEVYPMPDESPLFQGYRSRHHNHLNGRKLTTRACQYIISNAPTPKPMSPHDMRHSYSSIMRYEFGYSEEFIQGQLGHDDITTTRHYIGVPEDKRLEEIERRLKR